MTSREIIDDQKARKQKNIKSRIQKKFKTPIN